MMEVNRDEVQKKKRGKERKGGKKEQGKLSF
jgi:hypothetical protein